MAELAAGAVNSLLGLIRNEALLLSRVRGDVRFIKDEMESMKSFLAHLTRMTPPGVGHDEQVLTWMKQVEELAHDCRDCIIILYLHRGDPEVHRAMGGIQRYVRWFPWFVRKMIDQHRAASRLVELKERARDVSERRKRYDVEVPSNPSSSQAWRVAAIDALEYEEDDSDNEASSMDATDDDCRRKLLEPPSPVDYCTEKLADWLNRLRGRANMEGSVSSIAIVAPDEDNMAHNIVHQAVAMTSGHFRRIFWINQNHAQVHDSSWGIPLDILSYVLCECEKEGTSSNISDVQSDISRKIEEINVDSQIRNIVAKIEEVETMIIQDDENNRTEQIKWLAPFDIIPLDEPLGVLQQALHLTTMGPIDLPRMAWGTISLEEVVQVTAQMFKWYMEHEALEFSTEPPICLTISQYEYVLRKVFLASQRKQQAQVNEGNARNILVQDDTNDLEEEAIKSFVNKEAFGILGGAANGIPNKSIAAAIRETKDNLEVIKRMINEQMWVKEIVGKIEKRLKYEHTLIVLQDERDYISQWEETMNALNLLARTSCLSIAVVMVRRKIQRGRDYCYPQGGPIEYRLVESYHNIVLQLTTEPRSEDDKKKPHVLLGILEKCDPDEFCMKMLARALYANPNRSYSELFMLHEALDLLKDSMGAGATSNFKKMFKFSYNDLPKDYKSCLLYLAIFPQCYVINRSTIVGRWVTEGLIDKEYWHTSVDHADACFSTLLNRWFICAADIGPAGKVKSCVIGAQVHRIISKIAKKKRIVDMRLPHHLAHHFSIFSDLQLHRSDTIQVFLWKLPIPRYSTQLLLLKVLDLEGCKCFEENREYLKNICNKMSLLKYLSLRGTDVTHLPRQINNLHDLEVLDIRQTSVRESDTRHVLLLKLRRLLAGNTNPSASGNGIGITNRKQKSLCSCVSIPHKIEKMINLEMLSNVMAPQHGNELRDIGKLWPLRKLGVVINDNDKHLRHLLQTICDLNECLQSLTITITETRSEKTSTDKTIPRDEHYEYLVNGYPTMVLESLSINGFTRTHLLSLLAKGSIVLAKVALCGTLLKQNNLAVLASLPKFRCVRFLHEAYKDYALTFNKEEFKLLKCLIVDGDNMTDINFKEEAAVELEKIVLASTKVRSISGFSRLPMLKELELRCNELLFVPLSEDGGAYQKNNKPASVSKDGVAPKKTTELVSNYDVRDGEASQENTAPVSHSKEGEGPQESIELVLPSVDGPAPWTKPERHMTFRHGEFQHLKYFLCEDSKPINIIFEDGAALELDKIILILTNSESKLTVFGSSLGKLKEIEVKGNKLILLSLLKNANKIDKVTLCDTSLGKDELGLLAKKPNICCLVLLDNSYDESHLAFNKGDFPKLNLLIVKCTKVTNIIFNDGSAPKIEKIFWSCNQLESLSGIDNIENLKEIELNSHLLPYQVRKDIKAHKNKPVLVTGKSPKHQDY